MNLVYIPNDINWTGVNTIQRYSAWTCANRFQSSPAGPRRPSLFALAALQQANLQSQPVRGSHQRQITGRPQLCCVAGQ
jgi:hypothetical protein